jgi:rad52/22 double-strand break repair protein
MPNGEWVSRTDGGEKSQVAPFKGACSDALKRAAAQFGIGRYLYYVPNSWHSLLNDGKIFADIDSVRDSLPEWALPSKQIQDWEEIAIKEFKYGQDEVEELENPEKEADLIKTDDNKIKAIEEFLKKND